MSRKFSALLVAALGAVLTGTHAGEASRILGESLDDGLGELPHFSQWQGDPALAPIVAASREDHAVAGEKRDSGLGALPAYGQWSSHPELSRFAASGDPAPVQTARLSR